MKTYIQAISEATVEEMERDETVFTMGEDLRQSVYGATAGLVAAHRLSRREVAVVPDATDFHLPPGTPARSRPPGNRIVYAGSFMPYKDVATLRKFISERGKIRARRITGVSVQEQRLIARAIKNAREMALLPYAGAGR